jgi:hypothetical protein
MPFGYFNVNPLELAILVTLGVMIPYLLTLQKAVRRVSPCNRTMEPWMVWLMLVPCVNVVWQFQIATQVPRSLGNEFRSRRWGDGSDYGRGIALTSCLVGIVGYVPVYGTTNFALRNHDYRVALIGFGIGGLMGLVQLALFIWFWIKVATYSRQLAQGAGYGDRDGGGRFLPGDRDRSGESSPDTGPQS